jgi:hypothetical protein
MHIVYSFVHLTVGLSRFNQVDSRYLVQVSHPFNPTRPDSNKQIHTLEVETILDPRFKPIHHFYHTSFIQLN